MKRAVFGGILGVLVSLSGASPVAAQPSLIPFSAEYAGSKFPLHAKATIDLARRGDYYRYTMRGTVHMTFFKVTETYDCSLLQARGGELYPLEYVHRDRRDSDRNVRVRFDWERKTAHTQRGDGPNTKVDLQQIAWDVWSLHTRLRADAQTLTPGQEREYGVVEQDALKHYRARRGPVEVVEIGEAAIKAARMVAETPKREIGFWFAPDYGWLPVRMTVGEVTLELVSDPEAAARAPLPAAESPPTCR